MLCPSQAAWSPLSGHDNGSGIKWAFPIGRSRSLLYLRQYAGATERATLSVAVNSINYWMTCSLESFHPVEEASLAAIKSAICQNMSRSAGFLKKVAPSRWVNS